MAFLLTNRAYTFDVSAVDLNWYVRNLYDADLLDNIDAMVFGRTYTDVYYVNGYTISDDLEVSFGGPEITVDGDGAVTGGTVTGILEYDYNAGEFTFVLGDISVSAISLYQAALTTSTADEAALITTALSGDDIFSMSDFADRINGFAGNDTIYGEAGDDRLEGGDGNDNLDGGLGNDRLDGGTGTDTASYSVARAQANIVLNADGTLTINAGPEGIDTVGGVENFQFSDGLYVTKQFNAPSGVLVSNFAVGAGGWSSQDLYPRHIADVNGDGFSDIVGFGNAGVLVSFGSDNGSFTNAGLAVSNFGQTAGWSSDNQFHRELADVDGDGRSDIVGFGVSGTLVSLAKADDSFHNPGTGVANFGSEQGWANQDGFARTVGDVNGDGKADLVGFGYAGTLVSLGNGDGTFQGASLAVANFGVEQGWTSDNSFHRTVADVNGDGADDILGFGYDGTLVALSNGDGTFGQAQRALDNFGKNQGWSSQDAFARDVADVNDDGFADVVGFGNAGTFIAYGNRGGSFSAARFDIDNFGANQGWTSDTTYHRELADINNDGQIDIVGFGFAGVLAGYNGGDLLI